MAVSEINQLETILMGGTDLRVKEAVASYVRNYEEFEGDLRTRERLIYVVGRSTDYYTAEELAKTYDWGVDGSNEAFAEGRIEDGSRLLGESATIAHELHQKLRLKEDKVLWAQRAEEANVEAARKMEKINLLYSARRFSDAASMTERLLYMASEVVELLVVGERAYNERMKAAQIYEEAAKREDAFKEYNLAKSVVNQILSTEVNVDGRRWMKREYDAMSGAVRMMNGGGNGEARIHFHLAQAAERLAKVSEGNEAGRLRNEAIEFYGKVIHRLQDAREGEWVKLSNDAKSRQGALWKKRKKNLKII